MVIKIKNKQSLISRKLENKISKIKNSGFGFTLIELLVVISIIGILAALGIASYSRAEKNTRDTQRMSDLGQYRIALENYASANNMTYPIYSGTIDGLCTKTVPTESFAHTYLSDGCLHDILPLATHSDYLYYGNGSDYNLYAQLENPNTTYYFIICSTGKSGKKANPAFAVTPCPLP